MTSPLAQAIAFQNSVNPAQTGVAPTDVVGAYKLASDVAEKNYQAKIAQMMGLWGGLASLGSAGILGGKSLWAPALSKALGVGGTSAGSGSGILTGGAAIGVPQADFNAANAALGSGAGGTAADVGGGSVAADLGTAAPAGGTIAGDLAGTAAGAGADAAGSVGADLAGAAIPAAAGTDVAAADLPDFIMSILPFLA